MSENPVLAEVTRGSLVESVHRGSAVVATADGEVVAGWGDVNRLIYPRSSNKILQAIPLVETGAADRFNLDQHELALACASHMGEAIHVERVRAWLARVGLSENDLECGSHWPYSEASTIALAKSGSVPTPAHNNCSGKHSGFVTTAVHMGEDVRGYVGYDHPVQKRVTQTMSEMLDVDLFKQPWGTDGCGIPTIALPLVNLATAMARCADPSKLGAKRADAVTRLVAAKAAAPVMVSGTGDFTTEIMVVAGGSVVCKIGAEGMFTAILRKKGLGLALKVDDGTARGAEAALGAILKSVGALSDEEMEGLSQQLTRAIKNRAGLQVGELRGAAIGRVAGF